MNRIIKGVAVSCGVAMCLSAPLHAQVLYNISHELYAPGGMTTIPGQTVDYEGIILTANGTTSFLSYNVSCGNNVASAGCTQGPVTASGVVSGTVPGVNGLAFSASDASSGAEALALLNVTGTPASPLTAPLSISVTAGAFEQLNVNYTGTAPAPTNTVIDTRYALTAGDNDQTTGSTGDTSGAFASVSIEDPATYDPTLDANGYPSIQLLYTAMAAQGNLYPPSFDALSGNDPVTVALSHPYWIELFEQAAFSLPTGSTDNVSITAGGFADPSFSIDPTWLAANPQYSASDFSISQNYIPAPVPEPDTVWMLICGLSGLGFAVSRSRWTKFAS